MEYVGHEDIEILSLEETKKTKRDTTRTKVNSKKRKVEVEGRVWGESLDVQEKARELFLASGRVEDVPRSIQSSLKLISGISWVVHQLVKEMANVAVDMAWDCNLAALWEEWEGDVHLLNPPSMNSHIPPLTLPQRNDRVGEGEN